MRRRRSTEIGVALTFRPTVAVTVWLVAASVALTPPAAAQVMRGDRAGISVAGRATVHAPADAVWFEVMLTGNATDADLASIVQALKTNGVVNPQIVYPSFVNAGSGPTLRGAVRPPTRDRIAALGLLAQSLSAVRPALRLQRAIVTPFVDDCAKLEEQARTAALADARIFIATGASHFLLVTG
jgi:hypothetical protein